jgi:hypothetical protein
VKRQKPRPNLACVLQSLKLAPPQLESSSRTTTEKQKMDTETKRGMSHGELLTEVINNPDVFKLARF